MLEADPAIVARLAVDFRRPSSQAYRSAGADHGDAVGRAGQCLAIRAVADRDPLWIDLGLIGHEAAVTSSVDPHGALLPPAPCCTIVPPNTHKQKRRPKAPFV